MFDRIRLETHTSMNFAPADKLGFSIRSKPNSRDGDYNIDRTLDKLLAASQQGVIKAIPSSASAEDLANATYQILGQKNTPEVTAALKAGTPVYHVVQSFSRVFEYVPGAKGRTGSAEASIAGLGDGLVPNSADSPLV